MSEFGTSTLWFKKKKLSLILWLEKKIFNIFETIVFPLFIQVFLNKILLWKFFKIYSFLYNIGGGLFFFLFCNPVWVNRMLSLNDLGGITAFAITRWQYFSNALWCHTMLAISELPNLIKDEAPMLNSFQTISI